jgi:hypothetical protein
MKWTSMAILGFGSWIATDSSRPDPVKEVNRVPVKLMPPAGHVMLFKAKAVGAQIYVCKAKADDPDRFGWMLKAPDADLFDEASRKIGRHTAGPAWEASEDGGKVIGTLIEKTPAPNSREDQEVCVKYKATYIFYCAKE